MDAVTKMTSQKSKTTDEAQPHDSTTTMPDPSVFICFNDADPPLVSTFSPLSFIFTDLLYFLI